MIHKIERAAFYFVAPILIGFLLMLPLILAGVH